MNGKLIDTARRVNWYSEPTALLADNNKFLCEIMARGSVDDIVSAKSIFSEDAFKLAYEASPPGLFDRKSWSYWGLVLFSDPHYLPYPERFDYTSEFDWRS